MQNPKSNNASELAALRLENSALKQQLIAAQRSATLGELVGTTTHEFNNVLMTIMNYAKLGLRNKDDASREKSLTKILAASERAAKITHSVLGMARNRKDQFELTQIADLVNESMVLLEREMQRYRIHVELELDAVPDVPVNGNQIQQVVLNLLINARQAMPDGGSLIVRVKHDTQTNTVDLVVRDNGKGIPKDKLPRIFDPYFTTKSGPDATGKGGTGLGLATCKDIIQAHEGKIRVESQVGKGTCFTIKLPIKRAATLVVSMPISAATAASVQQPAM